MYTANDLSPEMILKIAQQLSLSEDNISQMCLQMTTMYRDNKIADVADIDGDGDTSNESRCIALEWYRKCLNISKNMLTKATCYYNILCLYKDFILDGDKGEADVESMISLLPELSAIDQHLLLDLACRFVKEYDNSQDFCETKIYRQLEKLVKDSLIKLLKTNDKLKIGCYLMECGDRGSAEKYWKSIIEQVELDKSQ
ncbi:unnamed protein product [Adineta ricciae]|uniref:Uncharacterized protein n=1 Tax=Adineta ricciae TaxID=249248 RepID=A0A814YNG9_ADIRI|nr:unnamed protein product [Adineta ricciae]CAF1231941.1 unnamed protein product [Adineta ricciae]